MATKDFSRVQEKLVADFLGEDWKVVSGSGAAPCTPGDVIGPDWLVECKTHVSKQSNLIFNKNVWKKIKDESVVKRRFPMLVTDDGTQKLDRTWALIRKSNIPVGAHYETFSLNIRSTSNVIVDILQLIQLCKSAELSKKYDHTNFLFQCSLDGDDCVIMKLSTFSELLGE